MTCGIPTTRRSRWRRRPESTAYLARPGTTAARSHRSRRAVACQQRQLRPDRRGSRVGQAHGGQPAAADRPAARHPCPPAAQAPLTSRSVTHGGCLTRGHAPGFVQVTEPASMVCPHKRLPPPPQVTPTTVDRWLMPDYFSLVRSLVHAAPLTLSVKPSRSVVSRIMTTLVVATSTHEPPDWLL